MTNHKKMISFFLASLFAAGICHAAAVYEGPNGEIYIGDYLPKDLIEKGYVQKGQKSPVKGVKRTDDGVEVKKTDERPPMRAIEDDRALSKKVMDAYIAKDYKEAVRLVKEQIAGLEKYRGSGKGADSLLYQKHVLLAHIYEWKFERPDSALAEYQKITALRSSSDELKKLPPIELLFSGEIYENRKEYPKALDHYKRLLDALNAQEEKDDMSVVILGELRTLVKYQIDGAAIGSGGGKNFTPMLKRLKFSGPEAGSLVQAMFLALIPTTEYDFSVINAANLADFIKSSPPGLCYMLSNYSAVLNFSANSVNEYSEKAFNAYLAKYPESFYSLVLRYRFYRFYTENGQEDKAKKILAELKKIGEKRGMEILTEPEKRFSSPENTFETYKKALFEGDMDTITECYLSGQYRFREAFTALGRDVMKQVARDMEKIEKITDNGKMAQYRTKRKENGKEVSYYIQFINVDGEWKMMPF